MNDTLLDSRPPEARPLWLATQASLPDLCRALPTAAAAWLAAHEFAADRGRVLALPGNGGELAGAVLGLGGLRSAEDLSPWDAAGLPERLPAGNFCLAEALGAPAATHFALGWLLGSRRPQHYRSAPAPAPTPDRPAARLVVPALADLRYARSAADASAFARDLINAPPNELGPEELVAAVTALARAHGGEVEVCTGEQLRQQYPLVHAVGAGSARAPRLLDCRWPRPGLPRVTLVGKGVCFDSGGLDLKPPAAMLLMKKDMGGAACAAALAQLLLQMAAPVELRLLIPAVENSVGASAFRPGDVWRSRKGLTVEIGNTDAEGRLVLADALAAADAGRPDLLVDLATLTGAARTALGPELPAVYSNDETLMTQLRAAATAQADPAWPLPLWDGYDEELSSRIADINNVAGGPFAGSIVAALFLRRFVTAAHWLHVDLYAWNPKERPGRPVGGEAQCVRALYDLVRRRYG